MLRGKFWAFWFLTIFITLYCTLENPFSGTVPVFVQPTASNWTILVKGRFNDALLGRCVSELSELKGFLANDNKKVYGDFLQQKLLCNLMNFINIIKLEKGPNLFKCKSLRCPSYFVCVRRR